MSKSGLYFAVVFSAVFSFYSFSTSNVDWDAITYSGINLVSHGFSVEEAHKITYSLLRDETTEAEFYSLISGDEYRAMNYKSVDIFRNQFYLHESKPLYLFLIHILTIPNYNLTIVMMKLISAVSGGFLLFLLIYWLSIYIGNRAVLLGMIVMILAGFSTVTKLTNPDALASLFCLLGSFLLMEKRSREWVIAAVSISLLVRPNYASFFLGLTIAEWFISSDKKIALKASFPIILISVFIPVVLVLVRDDYSWWRHFYHAFVAPVVERNAATEIFNSGTYITILSQMTRWAFHSYTPFPVMMLLSALIIVLEKTKSLTSYRIMFLWVGLSIQFLLFPHHDHRFWMHYAGLISVIFIITLFAGKSLNRQIEPHVSI